jgi:hypothetical protein
MIGEKNKKESLLLKKGNSDPSSTLMETLSLLYHKISFKSTYLFKNMREKWLIKKKSYY